MPRKDENERARKRLSKGCHTLDKFFTSGPKIIKTEHDENHPENDVNSASSEQNLNLETEEEELSIESVNKNAVQAKVVQFLLLCPKCSLSPSPSPSTYI